MARPRIDRHNGVTQELIKIGEPNVRSWNRIGGWLRWLEELRGAA
jgi:hypothetical protein